MNFIAPMRRRILATLGSLVLLLGLWGGARADEAPLRVAVLDHSVPLSYRDAQGAWTGFTVSLFRAICDEMQVKCQFFPILLDQVVDVLARGEYDAAAVNLLETPERRARILLSKSVFRSRSLWFSKAGVLPGATEVRVAVVQGSAQERYGQANGWKLQPVKTHGDIVAVLQSGQAQAALVQMMTSLTMMQQPTFRNLGLVSSVMDDPALGGPASFAIAPHRADLKPRIDAALDRVKRDGRYDRINTEFLPFRID